MTGRFVFVLTWLFVTCASEYVVAQMPFFSRLCSVTEVITFVHRGYSRAEIREKCSGVNVRRCSLTQVIRLAEDGATSREIYRNCGRRR